MGRCRWATSFAIKLMILLCSQLSSQHIFRLRPDYFTIMLLFQIGRSHWSPVDLRLILQLCSRFTFGFAINP
jgi:hypothetical protein